MIERKCLECDEKVLGRADKKFCSDQCRNTYNNKLNGNSNNHIRNVNNILRKNRRIIEELCPKGKSRVSKDKLITSGFNFTYMTSRFVTGKGDIYHYCYEYGYRELEKDHYMLVLKQGYVN